MQELPDLLDRRRGVRVIVNAASHHPMAQVAASAVAGLDPGAVRGAARRVRRPAGGRGRAGCRGTPPRSRPTRARASDRQPRAASSNRRRRQRRRPARPATRAWTQETRGTSAHGWSARPVGSSIAARSWTVAAAGSPASASASARRRPAVGRLSRPYATAVQRRAEPGGRVGRVADGQGDESGVVRGRGGQRRRSRAARRRPAAAGWPRPPRRADRAGPAGAPARPGSRPAAPDRLGAPRRPGRPAPARPRRRRRRSARRRR